MRLKRGVGTAALAGAMTAFLVKALVDGWEPLWDSVGLVVCVFLWLIVFTEKP